MPVVSKGFREVICLHIDRKMLSLSLCESVPQPRSMDHLEPDTELWELHMSFVSSPPQDRQTSFDCTLFYYLPRYYILLLQIEDWGDTASSKSISTIFPTAISHCMSLYPFGNSWYIANFFIIITFLMMIFDVPSMSHWSFRWWLACFCFLAENCIKVHALLRHNTTTCLINYSKVVAL